MCAEPVVVQPVSAHEPGVLALVDALTRELAGEGYADDQTFGYTPEQLQRSAVHLVGARRGGALVGIGGVELDDGGHAELKRFYVAPGHRGTGVADTLMAALVEHAVARGARVLRLETGDRQHAARAFYRRHGFADVPRFGPYVDSATSVCMERRVTAAGS